MQVKLLDKSRRAIELFVGLHPINEHRSAHNSDFPPGKDVEDYGEKDQLFADAETCSKVGDTHE